jgi:PAS domain S-box-containing protein
LHSLDDLSHIIAYSEHVGEALFAVDREWRVRAANRLALDFAHLTAERAIGRHYWEIVPPRGPITQALRDAMASGTPTKFEFASEFRPGSILCGVAIPLRDGLIVSFRDVTQERDLARANEERLRTIANNIPNGMVYQIARTPDGSVRFTYLSQAIERLHGLNAEAVLADPELLDSQVLDEYRPQLDALRLSADRVTEVSTEIPMRVPSGEIRWFQRASASRRLPGGTTIWDGVEIDVTERRRTEAALREREAELWNALEAASLATFEVDKRTRAVRSSPRLAEIYDYPLDRPLTVEDLRARCHPEDRPLITDQIARAVDPAEQRFEMEFRLLLSDGGIRWVNGRGEWIRDENGSVVGSRGIVLDISERKFAEERQTLLVHELNHRVKNTLATVQSLVSQTLRNAKGPGSAREDIEARLLAFSRAHDVLTRESWEGADLTDIVDEAIGPYREKDYSRFAVSGPFVRLKPQAALGLAMALQELATNAAKYGALSNAAGRVLVTWSVSGSAEERRLHFNWTESGGPPVDPPARRGFGSRLIERSLAQQLGADVSLRFPTSGLTCAIVAQL